MSVKIFLDESEIHRHGITLRLNIKPNPHLSWMENHSTLKALLRFPRILSSRVSTQRWIDIPEEVIEMFYRWRPSPLKRAVYLEKALDTPAKIFYKDESVSPAGSHKPNSAIPQAWYNKQFGTKMLTTETGAGQWGSALAFACSLVGLKCKVFMVRISFIRQPFRKTMMQTGERNALPAQVTIPPLEEKFFKRDPSCPGSLGLAISELFEAAVSDPTGKTNTLWEASWIM